MGSSILHKKNVYQLQKNRRKKIINFKKYRMSVKQEVVEYLIKHNTLEFNRKKVLEECIELSEVLIKQLTKIPELQPGDDKLVEEAGDTLFRIKVLGTHLGIWESIKARAAEKASQIKEHIDSGKYIGGR